jgi:hypothetical protein
MKAGHGLSMEVDLSNIYRKTLKGIDEVAFKTSGLPLRLLSYLLAVDGEASVDQLAARNQHLPSMAEVLQGLAGQGFLEVIGTAANVVNISQMRVGNGGNAFSAQQDTQPPQQMPMQAPPPQQQPQFQPQSYVPAPASYFPELEIYKTNMTRDVSALLGSDAGPVIQKIQACKTKDDLFAAMMGIKKIITIYADRAAADKFGTRYGSLAS